MTLPKFMPFNRLWSNRTNGKAITLDNCSIENLQENKMEIRQPENGDQTSYYSRAISIMNTGNSKNPHMDSEMYLPGIYCT
jgi:hypothetical protein